MPFTSYLVKKFDHAHENEFFRKFSENLKSKFDTEQGDHVLIGNLGINGNELDALFLKNGQITIIDFKNYGGDLTIGENSTWVLKAADGKEVFVAGGGRERNPFHQVRRYRRSSIDFLNNYSIQILDENHSDINWGHIGGLVLFHQKTKFNLDSFDSITKKWFHIADPSTIIDLLSDLNSNNLNLSDLEIRAITKVLQIEETTQLDHHKWEEELKKPNTETSNGSKLNLIKKLVDIKSNETLFQKTLGFYRTMLKVEQFKEPELTDLFVFLFEVSQSVSAYTLDLKASEKFHDQFVKNFTQNFPKNLFVAVTLSLDGKPMPLLYETILAADIKNKDRVILNLNGFELFRNRLDSMGLPEDQIEELSTLINAESTLDGKINVLREFLGVSIEMTKGIQVGLSSESSFTSQVVSELNKMKTLDEGDLKNTVFKSIVLNTDLSQNLHKALPLSPFIEVTSLNNSQRTAVKKAFESPLTVITGPPGTGKSQVVLNIMANAVANGYSVVFASKNNKAIDCVKDRFDLISGEEYLLRMGSKESIEKRFKPKIDKYISKIDKLGTSGVNPRIEILGKKIQELQDRVALLEANLDFIKKLPNDIADIKNLLEKNEIQNQQWEKAIAPDIKRLILSERHSISIDLNELNWLLKELNSWNAGLFSKLIFKIFKKNSFETKVKNLNETQPLQLYKYVSKTNPWVDPDKPFLVSSRSNLDQWKLLLSESEKMIEIENSYRMERDSQLESIIGLRRKLQELEESKLDFESEIQLLKSEAVVLGKNYLNLCITGKVLYEDLTSIRRFNDYLPANNVYKKEEVEDFKTQTKTFLKNFNILCMTNLSVKNSLPLAQGIIDLVVIDEASQCDFATALPLIYRAKKVVVIGDPLQLKHITSVESYEQSYAIETLGIGIIQPNYVGNSLYDIAYNKSLDLKIHSIFLDEHYRCHPEIINFSNKEFYIQKLGQSMNVMTSHEQCKFGDPGINWINVKGKMETRLNQNLSEVNRCVSLAKKLKLEYPGATIGIITPFRDQKNKLQGEFYSQFGDEIIADTVHRFQGDERDIIILSLVVSDDCPDSKANFINSKPELINVAITRAKSALYIVGNHSYCKKTKDRNRTAPLALLSQYAEDLKKVVD